MYLTMDNKLLGVIIIGFGLLVLFSKQEYSWVVSAIAVGIGSGFLIRKSEKNDLENWIDLTLAPKWFFSFKRLVGNWGYPVAGAMKGRKAIMSMSYGGNWFSIQTWFQNIPFRRIKAGVLKLGGMKTSYIRFYEVLPGMSQDKFENYMNRVRDLVRKL